MKITINNGGTFYNGQAGCLTRLMLLSIAVMVGAWLLPGVDVTSFWAVFLTAVVISIPAMGRMPNLSQALKKAGQFFDVL